MTERNNNNSSEATLADLEAKSPMPEWLTKATDEERFDQIFDALEQEPQEEPTAPNNNSDPAPVAAIEEPILAPKTGLPSRKELRQQEQRRRKRRGSRTTNIILAIVGLIGVVLLVIWAGNKFFSEDNTTPESEVVERNESPGSDGIIAIDVPAAQFLPGDCLTNYQDPTSPATVIECSQPHEAQLVGREELPEEDAYPGDEELATLAQDFCNAVEVRVPADVETEMTLTRPTADTWRDGDRTVDCFMSVTTGSTDQSFLP